MATPSRSSGLLPPINLNKQSRASPSTLRDQCSIMPTAGTLPPPDDSDPEYEIADYELDTTDEAVTEDGNDDDCSEEEGGEVGDEEDGREEDEEVSGVATGGQGAARHA
eukprot:1518438-Pleurochrysis_carterae.AAC.1